MIKSPNFTQIPNDYFDTIMKTLNGSENLVFLSIMRKTFGWRKKRDRISYWQIMELSGINSRTTIAKALKTLTEKGYIEAETKGQLLSYTVNVEDISPENEPVQKMNQSRKWTLTSPENEPVNDKTSPESGHTKESDINKLSKETCVEIENKYIESFKQVIQNGEPIIDYGAVRKRLKVLLSKLSKEKILSAVSSAMHDKWIVENGFSLITILGDNQLNKLINGHNGYTRQVQDSKPVPEFNVVCCGQTISRFRPFCIVCGKEFNQDGTEK